MIEVSNVMDIYEFIASLAASLAWPLAAIVIAFLLKRPVVQLLARAKSAEAFGTKWTFGDELKAIQEKIRTEPKSATKPSGDAVPTGERPQPLNDDHSFENLTDELLLTSATGTIVASWIKLEQGLKSIARFNEIEWNDRNVIKNLKDFKAMGLIPAQTMSAIDSLRMLRNKVVHEQSHAVSLAEAQSYAATVDEVLETIGFNASMLNWR